MTDGVQAGLALRQCRGQDVAISKGTSGKAFDVNRLEGHNQAFICDMVAIRPSFHVPAKRRSRAGGTQSAKEKSRPALRRAASSLQRWRLPSVCWIRWLRHEAKASRGDGSSLARHAAGELLALQSGGQVHLAAGEKAGEKLHHNLQSVAKTGRLRFMEWGSSFVGVDIVTIA